MCSKNKSIIAILCAIAIILGGVSVSASVPTGTDATANSVTPAPTVSNSTTSNSTPTLEQLQQIINMLQQQIQQLIVLVQQKIQVLQQTNAGEALNPLPNQQGAAQSCDQVCKAQGYTSGICRDYSSNITSSIGCQSGETLIKNSSCSMSAGFVDGGRICCCVGTPSTTAKNQCSADSDCKLSCSMGCVNKTWYQSQNRIDCMGLPINTTCVCNNGVCEKKSLVTATCAEVCRAQGYTSGQCSTYAISPEGMNNKCPVGYVASNQSASDCQIRRDANGTPAIGVGTACCCGNNLTSKCLQEGQTAFTSDQQYSGCCEGLQQNWLNVAPTTPQYNCTNCGNGKCDYGETNTNCSKDCYCGDGRCDAKETDTSCATDCANQCKKAGEQTNGLTASCCSGLTAASNCLRLNSNGACELLSGCGGAICIKCGDGTCGTGENKCNCPTDCKANIPSITPSTTVKNQCVTDSDCTLACSLDCVNKTWNQSHWREIDCMVLPPTNTTISMTCVCNNGVCEKKILPTTTSCAKEGEIVYPNLPGYESKPHFCCSGLTSIINSTKSECTPNDGMTRCIKCGDGTCGTGENKCNCPTDCGGNNSSSAIGL